MQFYDEYNINIARHVNKMLADFIESLRVDFTPSLADCFVKSDSRQKYLKNVPGFFIDSIDDIIDSDREPMVAPMPLKAAIIKWSRPGEPDYAENLNLCADALILVADELRKIAKHQKK